MLGLCVPCLTHTVKGFLYDPHRHTMGGGGGGGGGRGSPGIGENSGKNGREMKTEN